MDVLYGVQETSAVHETSIKGQDDYKLLSSKCGDREVPSTCLH